MRQSDIHHKTMIMFIRSILSIGDDLYYLHLLLESLSAFLVQSENYFLQIAKEISVYF